MTARTLVREARNFPATFILCAVWTAVFVGMVVREIQDEGSIAWMRFLVSGIGSGRRFGDLSVLDVAHGQVWRLITCNCVHFSVLHLGLNLVAMYQLGTLIESWYGSAQLLVVYVLTGGVGNLIGVAIRWALAVDPRVHSGGGSVVLLGLVGVCAVVGWSARRRLGLGLFRQMMILIGLTLLIGVVFPHSIDNWGHLGGGIMGVILGQLHGFWLSRYGRPSAWGSGVMATVVLVAGGLAQVASDIAERPLRQEQRLERKLIEHERLERTLAVAGSLLKQGADASQFAAVLDREQALGLSPGPATTALRSLLKASAKRKLSREELDRYDQLAAPVIKNSKRESMRIRGQLWRLERGRGGRA